MVFGEVKYSTPSRFLKEVPPALMAGTYSLDEESRYGDEGTYRRKVFGKSEYNDDEPRRGYSSSRFEDDEPPVSSIRPKVRPAGEPSLKIPPPKLLSPGTRVRHAKFGDGTVEQVIGEAEKAVYNVKFDTIAGKKLLDPKFAKLEPI
jgi:DNA helicase II / ATP-dependent DNA helicase PcrA